MQTATINHNCRQFRTNCVLNPSSSSGSVRRQSALTRTHESWWHTCTIGIQKPVFRRFFHPNYKTTP